MFEKLEKVSDRYDEINSLLFDPYVASNAEKYSLLMKEINKITPIALKYR